MNTMSSSDSSSSSNSGPVASDSEDSVSCHSNDTGLKPWKFFMFISCHDYDWYWLVTFFSFHKSLHCPQPRNQEFKCQSGVEVDDVYEADNQPRAGFEVVNMLQQQAIPLRTWDHDHTVLISASKSSHVSLWSVIVVSSY